MIPFAKYARQALIYDPMTGIVCWLIDRPMWHFATTKGYKIWKTRCAGKVAGNVRNDGYSITMLDRQGYLTHRLAWLLHTGDWPKQTIDHINGTKNDDRWINMRDISQTKNNQNWPISSRNTTGTIGVTTDQWVGDFFPRPTRNEPTDNTSDR